MVHNLRQGPLWAPGSRGPCTYDSCATDYCHCLCLVGWSPYTLLFEIWKSVIGNCNSNLRSSHQEGCSWLQTYLIIHLTKTDRMVYKHLQRRGEEADRGADVVGCCQATYCRKFSLFHLSDLGISGRLEVEMTCYFRLRRVTGVILEV